MNLLERQRDQKVKMNVPADLMVGTLVVIEHVLTGLIPCWVDLTFDSFILQATEEEFRRHVIQEPLSTTILNLSMSNRFFEIRLRP